MMNPWPGAYHVRFLGKADTHPSFRFSLHVDIQPTVVPTISIYGNVHTTVANYGTILWTLKLEPILVWCFDWWKSVARGIANKMGWSLKVVYK